MRIELTITSKDHSHIYTCQYPMTSLFKCVKLRLGWNNKHYSTMKMRIKLPFKFQFPIARA